MMNHEQQGMKDMKELWGIPATFMCFMFFMACSVFS